MIIKIPFTIPTQRVDGTSLAPGEIDRIEFFVSTDNGQNYVSAGHASADQTEFPFEASDPGTYLFKDQVVDTQSPPRFSPDSPVVSFTIASPPLAAPKPAILGTPLAG